MQHLRNLFQQARRASPSGYANLQSGRNYLYARITQKEPFDILYFTPGITAILNLDDHSYSLIPELNYTGITNLELRLRSAFLRGDIHSEYGEKTNTSKVELRLRYFF